VNTVSVGADKVMHVFGLILHTTLGKYCLPDYKQKLLCLYRKQATEVSRRCCGFIPIWQCHVKSGKATHSLFSRAPTPKRCL